VAELIAALAERVADLEVRVAKGQPKKQCDPQEAQPSFPLFRGEDGARQTAVRVHFHREGTRPTPLASRKHSEVSYVETPRDCPTEAPGKF
jgi:hypothetical protein